MGPETKPYLVHVQCPLAFVANVSVRFRAKNEEQESKTAAKSVFFCSETKRKRLLRRLSVPRPMFVHLGP